jgi:riboflavin transporter FmnP
VLRWCWYLGFGCAALLAFAGCVALIAMVSIYIYTITESGKLGDVIGSILQFVFGGAAVLATEFLVKKANAKVKD